MQIHRRIPPDLDSQLPQVEVTVLRPNILLHVREGHQKYETFINSGRCIIHIKCIWF